MSSNIVKLLSLMVLSVFSVSCGEKSKAGNQPEKQTLTSVLMEQEKSGLDESIYNVIANKAGLEDKIKNALMAQVKAAIETHTAVKADRDAAISKAVADTCKPPMVGFDDEIKNAVDMKYPLEKPAVLEKAENLGVATYKIFNDIFTAHPALVGDLNDLMALVKVIKAEETEDNGATQVTRNGKIDGLEIPAGGLGGRTVAQLKAALKIAMEADDHLPLGLVTLTVQADSGVDQRIYDKIIEEPLRGARTVAQLNAIMVAVRDAIAAHREPIAARDQLIVDAVAAQGGANAPYSNGIKNIVDVVHPAVLILEAASHLLHDTYVAVVNTAHANLNNGHRNRLIARIVTAKGLGTTVLRNNDIDAAVREVRGLAVGAALAGEDLTLATAIKGAVATDYPFAVTTLADSGLDNAVYTVISGCARDPEQKNNLMVAVRAVITEANPGVRTGAISAAVNANSAVGAADIATISTAIQTAVTNTYFDPTLPSFAASLLDGPVYGAIREATGLSSAHKTTLIGDIHPRAATQVRAAMNARPRVKATRDGALGTAVTALVGLSVADAAALTMKLIEAAELAQPADLLTDRLGSGLPAQVYHAIVGDTVGGVIIPLAITNAQMNAIMLPVLNALNLRPCVKATRDRAIEDAVRGALGMDPAAVLAAGTDALLWAHGIKAAAEVAQPATALTAKPDLMEQSTYDAITGNTAAGVNVHKGISNLQMNAIIELVETAVLKIRDQEDKATRDGRVDGFAGDTVNVTVVGGPAQPVPVGANWNTAIKAALDLAIPEITAKPTNLAQEVYDYVIDRYASNKAMNELNAALEAALAIDSQAGRFAALNPVLDSFMDTVLNASGGNVVADADKASQKEEIIRLFNKHHPLAVAGSFEGTVRAMTGGFDVTITVSSDTAVAKKKDRVFLPADMTAGLPLKNGDTVVFDSLSADKNGSVPSWGGWASTKVKSVDAAVVNYKNL